MVKLFDDYFSAQKNVTVSDDCAVSERVCACCMEFLRNGDEHNAPSLSAEEGKSFNSWISRYKELTERARRLALAGEARDGLAFDEIKRLSLALADETLPRAHRGDVFVRVAQAFDQAVSGADNKLCGKPKKEIVVPWTQFPVLDRPVCQALQEIQKFASWDDSYKNELEHRCEDFKRAYPQEVTWIKVAVQNGEIFKNVKARAYRLAFQKKGKVRLTNLLSEIGMPNWVQKKMWENFAKGQKAKDRITAARKIVSKVEQKPSGTKKAEMPFGEEDAETKTELVGSVHPNSLLNLKPAKKWTIVSDETGTKYGNEAFASDASLGRYVMVIVPEGAHLPELPLKWHAIDKTLEEQLRVAEILHQSGCGVLGIPVTDLRQTNRGLWFACIESLLDIALRILPIDGETKIELNVEQCGDRCAKNAPLLERTLDAVMYHLSLTDPRKAKQIRLSGRFIAKDESPHNGYADVVAYSWGCSKMTRRAFTRFGWIGPCLIDDDPTSATIFRKCLTLVQRKEVLPGGDWNALVVSGPAKSSDSLIGALLRAFGEASRKNADLWRKYLDYTVAHLDSKAIRLSVLGAQIAWLKEYEPDDVMLPPRLRLLWLTAQLAAFNHTGGTYFGVAEHKCEFAELKKRLKDEDAPLVCFADLHLAVELTDRFEFMAARDLLLPWLDEPIAVPGLRYHGQVLSSLGQHEAFLGNNEKALNYFDQAIAEFKRLSEHAQSEIDHTLAYAVIAAMDAKSPRLNELLATYLYRGAYSVETMVDMANQFASIGEDKPDSKYAHAILLRYLVMLPIDNPVRLAYLSHVAEWKWSTDGHPWELIAFYRAILLGSTHAGYRTWLRRGYDLAKSGGPTLKLIALVIGAGLIGKGSDAIPESEYQSLLEEIVESLPALGDSCTTALRDEGFSSMTPLSRAAKILPFNFR